jgi:hypothetical protein
MCFAVGTGILMSGGYAKVIENIRVGDLVKSYDEATGLATMSRKERIRSEPGKYVRDNGDFYQHAFRSADSERRIRTVYSRANGERVHGGYDELRLHKLFGIGRVLS